MLTRKKVLCYICDTNLYVCVCVLHSVAAYQNGATAKNTHLCVVEIGEALHVVVPLIREIQKRSWSC